MESVQNVPFFLQSHFAREKDPPLSAVISIHFSDGIKMVLFWKWEDSNFENCPTVDKPLKEKSDVA